MFNSATNIAPMRCVPDEVKEWVKPFIYWYAQSQVQDSRDRLTLHGTKAHVVASARWPALRDLIRANTRVEPRTMFTAIQLIAFRALLGVNGPQQRPHR